MVQPMAMQADPSNVIRRTLARMPQWLRIDLSAGDALRRERAEDALCAIIMAALAEPDSSSKSEF